MCFASASERLSSLPSDSSVFYLPSIFLYDIDCYGVSSDVLKMDTHLAGIICRVASIFATNVLITTTEGNVEKEI